MRLYPRRIDRDFPSTDENKRILDAYNKILMNEGGYGTGRAKKIRTILSKIYKLTSRDVSVKSSRGGGIDIKLKTPKALPYKKRIERIGSEFEVVHRDDFGNILKGGNFFIFTDVEWKLRQKIAEKIKKEIDKKITDDFMNDIGSNIMKVFGYEFYKEKGRPTFRVVDPKSPSAGMELHSLQEVADRILHMMLEYEDIKNLKKLS